MKLSLLLVCVLLLISCASLAEKQTQSMADSLSLAIMDNDDPDVVRDGAPAFLLMFDGFIHNSPESEGLLLAGAQLNSGYASVIEEGRKNLMVKVLLARVLIITYVPALSLAFIN